MQSKRSLTDSPPLRVTVSVSLTMGTPVGSLEEITNNMKRLVELYPAHIEKEDKYFFYPCMEYFNKQEQDDMLQEFWDFDQKMIHEKYQKVVDKLKGG